jgi:hypothetical protein
MNSQNTILTPSTTTSSTNCLLPVIKIKADPNDQPVHSESLKPFCKSTFIDFDNSFDKDGNFGIGFNVPDACEQETLVSQRPNETPMLVFRTSTSVVHSVVDSLKVMW